MRSELNLLVVATHVENKKSLLGVLHGLPINVYSSTTIEGAQEVLSGHDIIVVFCEGQLTDGPYRDLLSVVCSTYPTTRFVVVLSAEEWPEKHEALRLGASDVLRCPLQAADVELVLLRAVRGELERSGLLGGIERRHGPVQFEARGEKGFV